jgi:hypothetical protein
MHGKIGGGGDRSITNSHTERDIERERYIQAQNQWFFSPSLASVSFSRLSKISPGQNKQTNYVKKQTVYIKKRWILKEKDKKRIRE